MAYREYLRLSKRGTCIQVGTCIFNHNLRLTRWLITSIKEDTPTFDTQPTIFCLNTFRPVHLPSRIKFVELLQCFDQHFNTASTVRDVNRSGLALTRQRELDEFAPEVIEGGRVC